MSIDGFTLIKGLFYFMLKGKEGGKYLSRKRVTGKNGKAKWVYDYGKKKGKIVMGKEDPADNKSMGKVQLIRRTNKDSPMSDWGHAMFAFRSPDELRHYGDKVFTVDKTHLTDISSFRDKIKSKFDLAKRQLDLPETMTADEFADLFDPQNIVDTAQAWDNDKFIEWFSDNIDSTADGYLLKDGAVVFNKDKIQRKKELDKQ